jgi:hypothetical protein
MLVPSPASNDANINTKYKMVNAKFNYLVDPQPKFRKLLDILIKQYIEDSCTFNLGVN